MKFDQPSEPALKLTLAMYHALIDADLLTEDDPVELLEGWVIEKMPRNPMHHLVVQLIADLLASLGIPGYFVQRQDPIDAVTSEPEPDLAVIPGEPRDYIQQHPLAAAIPLVIEVADSSLARDRGVKKQIYARCGIPVYWIVNLRDRCVEFYTHPDATLSPPDYAPPQIVSTGEISIEIAGAVVAKAPIDRIFPDIATS